ncbi:protein kinase [Streptomyces sp. NPDC051677]|uniref:protein kinase domain-containing protein n=1 Tax=Streptomyces sp. NPDC051677 TaxID=3365669 RepID=UPI0037CD55BF
MLRAAEALSNGIHACGIVHRDLKPGNIVVSGTGPRVIDFGLARVLEDSHITLAHQVVGTPAFLAPEQLAGTAITPAADLYAFGMVLCHAAGVMPPKHGQTLTAALELLPRRLAAVITRCLQKNPDDRPTPAEVIDALSPDLSPSEDWLPPRLRALVDLHNRPAASAT